MNKWSYWGALALCLGGTTAPPVQAQGLRMGASTAIAVPKVSRAAAPAVVAEADHIVAVVNSEPITQHEVRARLARLQPPEGATLPPRAQLERQVLDRLVLERIQLQQAKEQGLKVEDAALADAEAAVARQNSLTVEALRERVQAMGLTLTGFRADLKRDLLLQRLREREVDSRVRVSEADIDAYLAERQRTAGLSQTELQLAQVLVRVPEGATPEVLATLQARAEQVRQRASGGADFAALAQEFSEAPERDNGGQLGLRSADRYPALFVDATRALKVGEVSAVVRSGAGFHILKVLEKRAAGLPEAQYTQTRARHILLRPNAQLSEAAALARLNGWREQVLNGKATFEALARQHSQDGSAAQGGDLGWASPGQFVPEFEQAMDELAPGQVSMPLVSRFGVHLIQVQQRRQAELTPAQQRDWVRNLLREQKTETAYANWLRDLRAQAYVEYREAPQP